MAGTILNGLQSKADVAWVNFTRQLQGMEPYMDRSNAPGEWTTREVLVHLLAEPGSQPVEFLKKFSERDLPPGEVTPGRVTMTDDRHKMTLRQFLDALEAQRREVFAYLETLSDADLQQRKARIPFFKQFMGTDEVSLAVYINALFNFHWNDHAGQLAKIRKAVGLPDTQ